MIGWHAIISCFCRPGIAGSVPAGNALIQRPVSSGRHGLIVIVALMAVILFGGHGFAIAKVSQNTSLNPALSPSLYSSSSPTPSAYPSSFLSPNPTFQHILEQGLHQYDRQEYIEAIRYFEMALQYPDPPRELYMYIVSSHLMAGNFEQAGHMADQGLDEYPGSVRLKAMKGEALIHIDIMQAIKVFEQVWNAMEEAQADQLEDVQKDVIRRYISRLYQQKASESFTEGDLSTAAGFFEQAKRMDRADMSNHVNLAYTLIQLNEWNKAQTAVKDGLDRFPESWELLMMQAQIYEHQENMDALLETLERLYRADPSNMERAVMYGRALLGANRAVKADTFFREKIRTNPQERILYETLLDLNRDRFNQTGILEVLRLKMKQFPGEVELEEQYGIELLSARNFDKAHAWFDSLAVAYGNPEFGRMAAHTWLFDEDYDAAERAYRTQLERWPEHTGMMGEFGRVLARIGKDDEAREVLRTVLEQQDDPGLRYLYGALTPEGPEREDILEPLMGTLYEGRARWLLLAGAGPQRTGAGDASDSSQRVVSRNTSDARRQNTMNASDSRQHQTKSTSDSRRHQTKSMSVSQRLAAKTSDLPEILIGMLGFVEQRQMEVRKEAQTGLDGMRAVTPPLLQTVTELDEVGKEVRTLLGDVRAHLPFEASSNIINEALAVYPESALLMHHKGALYFEHEMAEPAKEYLLEAAEREAKQKETHYLLGQVYKKLNNFDQAVLSFERVIALDPENRPAYRALIRIHQQHGNMEQLGDRWLQRYHFHKGNDVFREFLVEVLHRADRFDEARAVLE